uniref:SGNH/GDSL hydrolase family protein n=1 Tax=Prevotella sp. GTC17260 TaxID=3236796 RepID=A0AB33JEU6_9BACT
MKRFFILIVCLILFVLSGIAQTKWYSPVSGDTLLVRGRAWNAEIGKSYQRIPNRFKPSLRKPLWDLSQNSAGLYIEFITDAPEINIHYKVFGPLYLPNVVPMAKSGVDLYAFDVDGNPLPCSGNYTFSTGMVNFHYGGLTYPGKQWREYRLYLPLYNTVDSLQIGVPQNSKFEFMPASLERPIVVYGTSIAQGASASRPGMAWTNILQRKLDAPVYNLGHSGNGRLEKAMFNALSEINARLFIVDCMPNMSVKDSIASLLREGVNILRSKSDAPILLVEHCGYNNYLTVNSEKTKVDLLNSRLKAAYQQLQREGVKGLYYLTKDELGVNSDLDSQIDGVHATDIGMRSYAEAYMKKIAEILDFHPMKKFMPVRQTRDQAFYNWSLRHHEIMQRNRQVNPDVVMIGNSITHYWAGEPAAPIHRGDKAWKKLFGKRKVTNMGYGWDRIENIFWRLYHGELDGISPRHIFMMAGTNNVGSNTDEEIVDGIEGLVKLIQKLQPQACIHVVKIYPRRGQEQRLQHLNTLLQDRLARYTDVDVVDVTKQLTTPDGRVDESLFVDGLHPNAQGYERIARVYQDFLK